jgi:hypothetical protein
MISLSDPLSAWTAKANKRVQFGYGHSRPATRDDRQTHATLRNQIKADANVPSTKQHFPLAEMDFAKHSSQAKSSASDNPLKRAVPANS